MDTKKFFNYLNVRKMKAVSFVDNGKLQYVKDFASCELYARQLFGETASVTRTVDKMGSRVKITDGFICAELNQQALTKEYNPMLFSKYNELHIVYWWILPQMQVWMAYHILGMTPEQFEPLRKGAEEGKLYKYLTTLSIPI